MGALGRQLRLGRVDAEKHLHAIARVGIAHAKELTDVFESFSAEGPIERMVRRIKLDDDMLVLRQVCRSAPAQHAPELRPGFLSAFLEVGERDRGAVDT